MFQEVRRVLFLPSHPLVQSRVRVYRNEVFPVSSDFHEVLHVELIVSSVHHHRLLTPVLIHCLELTRCTSVVRLSYVEQIVTSTLCVRLTQCESVQNVRTVRENVCHTESTNIVDNRRVTKLTITVTYVSSTSNTSHWRVKSFRWTKSSKTCTLNSKAWYYHRRPYRPGFTENLVQILTVWERGPRHKTPLPTSCETLRIRRDKSFSD